MSEDSNFFIYTRDGNNQVEKHAIIPFAYLVPLGERHLLQTNDTCKSRILWQGYFGLATEHYDDIPIYWDGTKSSELQGIQTYTVFKNDISQMGRLGRYGKRELKENVFPTQFLDYSSSFHRTIINFIGQNDNNTYGLTDEPYDVNLTKEFINGTGYDIDQLVSEKKLYHNIHIRDEQFRNNTYVWFYDLSLFDNNIDLATGSLRYFFRKKQSYIIQALEKANLQPNEDNLYNFSNEDNRNKAKAALTSAGINMDFESVFNNYDERLILTGDINKLDEFINDLSEYLTFESFCGNYVGHLDNTWYRAHSNNYNSSYLLQIIFTQITMDYLDEPAEVRRQIFDGIVKIRDFFIKRNYCSLSANNYGQFPEEYFYFTAYNPTENPIQYIVNSILPKELRLTGEKFDLFIEHINYMYKALTNLSPDASVTRLTLWTIPPDLDKKFGFIRDGVFCRTLFDVVEKYNSLTESERIANDLKQPPKKYEILTAKEVQKLSEEPEITSSEEKTNEQEEPQPEDETPTTEEIQNSPAESETTTSEEETAEPEITSSEEKISEQEESQQEDETLTIEEIQNSPAESETTTSEEETAEPEITSSEEKTSEQEESQQEDETLATEEIQNPPAESETTTSEEETNAQEESQQEDETLTTEEIQNSSEKEINKQEESQQEDKEIQKLPETKLERQEPKKRKCIKISGATATIFGFLMLALGASAQIVSFGIPNPISIALMAVGGAFIASGSGTLIYRTCKNKQEETLISNSKDDDNTQSSMESVKHEENNNDAPFLTPERIEQAKVQAKTLPENQTTNPTMQPTL